METQLLNGLKFTFDKVIEFEQTDNDLLECFFFKNEVLVTSQFLTLFELKKLKDA